MGWLAIGGVTVIAGGMIYNLLDKIWQPQHQESSEKNGHEGNQDEEPQQHTPSAQPVQGKPTTPRSQDLLSTTTIHTPTAATTNPEMPVQDKPLVNRSRSWSAPKSPPRLNPPTFSNMSSAAPRPSPTGPPPSTASHLRVPQTKPLPSTSMAPSSFSTGNLMAPPAAPRPPRRPILSPGHSPLDWAALITQPSHPDHHFLLGLDFHALTAGTSQTLLRVTPSQLRDHRRRGRGRAEPTDVWTVYQGKVYNLTAYLPFHPGGEGELMRAGGKEAGKLFMEVHPWVNWDGILGECCVGVLVAENDGDEIGKGKLDEMD